MMKNILRCWLFLFLALSPLLTYAKHIMGGDLKMQHLGKRGTYHFSLSVFIDNIASSASSYETSLNLMIYDRMTGKFIEDIAMQLTKTRDLVYDNPSCQKRFSFSATEMLYEGDFTFNDSYNAEKGYVILWDRCCRNTITRNISFTVTNNIGSMFSIEVKAFFDKKGKEFINSTPDFGSPNGSFLCVKDAMALNMQAYDKDGDELRYSLTTPVRGYTSSIFTTPQDTTVMNFDNLPLVQWASGFSATSPIPSSVPITINSRTGLVEGKVSEVGVFVYAVMVEEFRNGERISISKREFQIATVDCSLDSPPTPIITEKDIAIETLTGCEGDSFTLKINPYNPALNYQWQYNDNNLAFSTGSTIVANLPGKYTVAATFKDLCTSKVLSKAVNIKNHTLPDVNITPNTALFCDNTVLKIAVKDSVGNTYQWFRNQVPIANTNTAALEIKENGVYIIEVKDQRYNCTRRDTLEAFTFKSPRISLTANATNVCEKDTFLLFGEVLFVETPQYTQNWFYENKPANIFGFPYWTTNKGKYTLKIEDSNGCITENSLLITAKPSPVFRITPIPPICDDMPVVLQVNATNSDGQFTGIGVEGNRFIPQKAGLGSHVVTYNGVADNGCKGSTTQVVVVDSKIALNMPPSFKPLKGNFVQLTNTVNRQDLTYSWTPTTNLDNPLVQIPTTNTLTKQTYTLRASSATGCFVEAQTIVEPVGMLYIPTAFTPNNDGRNDTWEITNLDLYTSSVVQVYNRWGELVFYSKNYQQPFDGKDLSGQMLPTGGYVYRINVFADQEYVYEGALSIIR